MISTYGAPKHVGQAGYLRFILTDVNSKAPKRGRPARRHGRGERQEVLLCIGRRLTLPCWPHRKRPPRPVGDRGSLQAVVDLGDRGRGWPAFAYTRFEDGLDAAAGAQGSWQVAASRKLLGQGQARRLGQGLPAGWAWNADDKVPRMSSTYPRRP